VAVVATLGPMWMWWNGVAVVTTLGSPVDVVNGCGYIGSCHFTMCRVVFCQAIFIIYIYKGWTPNLDL
jgi:hypothetical protein